MVKRYTIDDDSADMFEDDSGAYVTFVDYEIMERNATDDEVLQSLQEEFNEMQKTARAYAARVRDFEVAAMALRTMFRLYQKRTHSDAHVLLPAVEPLFKLLTPDKTTGEQ